jgi:peptide deformylase
MILEVVKYGHPVLRQKGLPIEKITPEIKKLIADMFETMHERHGVGLAAQQIGKALQLTVIDVREAKDRPSTLELKDKPADVEEIMPLVLINPEIKPSGEFVESGEGCLSFPEIFAEISRPEFVDVKALNE